MDVLFIKHLRCCINNVDVRVCVYIYILIHIMLIEYKKEDLFDTILYRECSIFNTNLTHFVINHCLSLFYR